MELLAPWVNLAVRLVIKELWVEAFIRSRLDSLREPPLADPHEGWCGEGELKSPPYPIRQFSYIVLFELLHQTQY
jgi:hypothetical protein